LSYEASYIVYLLGKGHGDQAVAGKPKGGLSGKVSFWLIVLATGELYGGMMLKTRFKALLMHIPGFMTFAPEWLAGNPNLDGSNWMYLYVTMLL
jgi:hypothetical protein